jgi:hypothetical protein
MKALMHDAEAAGRHSVDLIHKTLYCFSNNNLHTLMRENAAFRYILTDSLNRQEEIFHVTAASEDDRESLLHSESGMGTAHSQATPNDESEEDMEMTYKSPR